VSSYPIAARVADSTVFIFMSHLQERLRFETEYHGNVVK
jgi:hypothetical protein